MTMPNDNQPAKSYIETVMARADGATSKHWRLCARNEYPWILGNIEVERHADTLTIVGDDGYGVLSIPLEITDGPHWDNFKFIAAARQDIPTLAKMLLRAIEALEERAKALTKESDNAYNGESYQLANMLQCEADYCTQALAEINALSAKGSQ